MSGWGRAMGRDRFTLAIAGLFLGTAAVLLGLFVRSSSAELTAPGASDRRVTQSVSTLLTRLHLARRPLDDELSRRSLGNFLKMLDPMKIHFLQSDVDEFETQRDLLDDQILKGDIKFGYTIFKRLLTRIDERVKVIDDLLAAEHDFTVDEQMMTDPDSLAYPKDEAEALERWRKRIKYDLLVQKESGKTLAEAREKLLRRYHSFAKRMKQTDADELLEMYLTAMTTSYDPHTAYMSATSLKNFKIQMQLNLDGIGASLQSEDGVTTVQKIIRGGAADKDGRLKVKDQIVAVGQGNEGEMVDVVDMKLNDVVDRIRGKKGTIVRLGVITDADKTQKTYDITRDHIELKDSEAQSEVFTDGKKADGTPYKVGVIDLPSFYMDMDAARQGQADFKSTTRDVTKILEKFRAEGVDAVVVDLRQNGGGSLNEAVSMTGLFIESGPVVQVKGFDGEVEAYPDRDPTLAWNGPLVVLVSKFSASASEIFAGAIQDYGRGLVIGDKTTHGKGTVQQLLDLSEALFNVPNGPQLGALKVTIQQFYRPNGDSTQNRGVVSDLELPALTTHLDVGESDLDYALAFDKVKGTDFKHYNMADPNLIAQLRKQSEQRVDASDDFKKVKDNISRYHERKKRKTEFLQEEKFLAERARLEAEKKLEQQEEEGESRDPEHPIKRDFYLNEVLGVTTDYVDQLNRQRVAIK